MKRINKESHCQKKRMMCLGKKDIEKTKINLRRITEQRNKTRKKEGLDNKRFFVNQNTHADMDRGRQLT
jgi:hypothetical protein